MGKLTSILFCLIPILAAAEPLPGQGTVVPKPPASTAGKTTASKPSATNSKPETPDTPVTPSRYAYTDPKAYAATLVKRLAIGTRVTDPFGQPQDPDAKPVVKAAVAKGPRRPSAEPPTPLSQIVSQIKVTMIMSTDRRFLVNDRSFGLGDKIPLNFRNKRIHTEVTEVTASRIVFRNVETGELGILKLDMLPIGMSRGTEALTPPGMSPANPNAPLEIDSPSSQAVTP